MSDSKQENHGNVGRELLISDLRACAELLEAGDDKGAGMHLGLALREYRRLFDWFWIGFGLQKEEK